MEEIPCGLKTVFKIKLWNIVAIFRGAELALPELARAQRWKPGR
jgi:hypothetical protein